MSIVIRQETPRARVHVYEEEYPPGKYCHQQLVLGQHPEET
jgi:hypothetical protein